MPDKIRVLQVRPIQSADLAFDIGGIIDAQLDPVTLLGKKLKATDLAALIAGLGAADANGQLICDAKHIENMLSGKFLFALRRDLTETALQQALAQRQMTYLDKYKHTDEIVSAFKAAYDTATGKIAKIKDLQKVMMNRTTSIGNAIKSDPDFQQNGQDGTNFVFRGSDSYTDVTPVAMRSTRHTINIHDGGDLNAEIHQTHEITDNWTIPAQYTAGATPSGTQPPGNDAGPWVDLGSNDSFSFKSQKTSTKYSDFRHPYYDNQIRGEQAQIGLADDLLQHSVIASKVPDLQEILNLERQAIDLDVQKLQLLLIHSYLIPPFAGTVTTVYKNVGEAVRPGEVVLRLENDERVFLVGIVQHRGIIRVEQAVSITSSGLFDAGIPLTISGQVRSIRGHDPEDDEWDIIIQCDNPTAGDGQRLLPINYSFDRDTTQITFT